MAITSSTNWEVQTGGAATNGGGYDGTISGAGTDYSQQTTAQLALTDIAANGTTTLTSATGGFTSAMIGNLIYLTGGSAPLAAVRRQITAYTDTNTITVDATVATSTGVTGNVGGAVADLRNLCNSGDVVAGNWIFVKAGTYSATALAEFTLAGTGVFPIFIVGYDTTRTIYNHDASRPLFTTATNSTVLFRGNTSSAVTWRNINFSNTAGTKASCFSNQNAASANNFLYCSWDGFTSAGPSSSSSSGQFAITPYYCSFLNCTTAGMIRGSSSSLFSYSCYFYNCTTGMSHSSTGGPILAQNSIFNSCTTAILSSRTVTAGPSVEVTACSFYNCGTVFRSNGNSGIVPVDWRFINNIAWGGDYGIRFDNAVGDRAINVIEYENNAFGGQSVAALSNFPAGANQITLTANPFVDATNHDFNLNNSAGGGALVKANAIPLAFLNSATSKYKDMGASQNECTGTGGGQHSYSG